MKVGVLQTQQLSRDIVMVVGVRGEIREIVFTPSEDQNPSSSESLLRAFQCIPIPGKTGQHSPGHSFKILAQKITVTSIPTHNVKKPVTNEYLPMQDLCL